MTQRENISLAQEIRMMDRMAMVDGLVKSFFLVSDGGVVDID